MADLPAHTDRDRAYVGGCTVARSVHEPVLRVYLDAAWHLARDPTSNVVSELVLAGIDEAAI